MNESQIQEAIASHEARNIHLKQLLTEKGIDLKKPRPIECHFYATAQSDANALAVELQSRGFRILANRKSADRTSGKWNVEAQIIQTVDLTMRREFIDELVRLADAHHSEHDGWGTEI